MINPPRLYVYFSLLLLTTCIEPVPEHIKTRAFQTATFDTAIIARVNKYVLLNDFLAAHVDEILQFRDAEYRRKYRSQDSSSITYMEYYMFFKSLPEIDMPFMPQHLIAKTDSISRLIGTKNLNSFIITRNRKIVIEAKVDRFENTALTVGHKLLWDERISLDPNHDFAHKDTLLANGVIYRINVNEFHD